MWGVNTILIIIPITMHKIVVVLNQEIIKGAYK